MGDAKSFDTTDQLAGIFLGTALVAGATILAMALFAPKSLPLENRATVIAISTALVMVGSGGGIAYLRWRSRQQQKDKLNALAQAGALRLGPGEYTQRLVEISFALAEELLLPPACCELRVGSGAITAKSISESVGEAIARLEQQEQMRIAPGSLRATNALVARFTDGPALRMRMDTRLADVVPMRRRREMWLATAKATAVRVPVLTLPPWGMGIAMVLALAITFGTTIALAQWLDQAHPVRDPSVFVTLVAKLIVRGGFFVILTGCGFVFALLFWKLFPTFPGGCRTVRHLSGYLNTGTGVRESWNSELVWAEVRRIIAETLRVPESQVRPTTECG